MSDNFGFESQFKGENCIFNLLTPEEMSALKANSTITRLQKNVLHLYGRGCTGRYAVSDIRAK